jgi:hypothetical protein
VHSLGDSLESDDSVDRVLDIAGQRKHHNVASLVLQAEGFAGTDTLSSDWYSMARERLVGMNACRSSPMSSQVGSMFHQVGPFRKTERDFDQIPLFLVGLDRDPSVMIVLLLLCLSTVSQETSSDICPRLPSATTPLGLPHQQTTVCALIRRHRSP